MHTLEEREREWVLPHKEDQLGSGHPRALKEQNDIRVPVGASGADESDLWESSIKGRTELW